MKMGAHRGSLILALTLPLACVAQDNYSVDTLHLSESVYLLRNNTPVSNPSSVVSIGSDGVFLVDAGFLAGGPELLAKLDELGGGPISHVATTHYHGDHSQGLEFFAPGTTVIGTEAQRQRLATESVTFDEDGPPLRNYALADITVAGAITVRLNGEVITVFQPLASETGHTDGDLFVYFENADVLYVGDYVMLNGFPFIDLKGGGDVDGFLDNIAALIDRFDEATVIVPGHGSFAPVEPVTLTMGEFRDYYQTLIASINHVKSRAAAGLGVDEIIEEGLPIEFDGFNPRPNFVKTPAWIRQIFDYYTSH